jgi:hypothetical protein
MTIDYKKEYKDALLVQSACNMTGIANSLIDLLKKLRGEGLGSDDCHSHDLIKAYVHKLATLSAGHSHYESSFRDAMERVGDKYLDLREGV